MPCVCTTISMSAAVLLQVLTLRRCPPCRRTSCAAWGKTSEGRETNHSGALSSSSPVVSIRPPLARAFRDAAHRHGYADVEDMNGDFADGHCTLPVSRTRDTRGSAGLCYLTAEVRARPNLRVLTEHMVEALAFHDPGGAVAGNDGAAPRVVGVRVCDAHGGGRLIRGREVIVCAGALRSPELLLRSGTPPAIVNRLSNALRDALRDNELREKFLAQGAEPTYASAMDFSRFVSAERKRFGALIQEARISAE